MPYRLGHDRAVARWTCPECNREFGRNQQSHDCAPAMSLEEYFSTGPPHERPVWDAVKAHLDTLPLSEAGELHIEPVSVGIFLKSTRTFAQLRPKQKWVALSMGLSHRVSHPRIGRKVVDYNGRYYTVFNLRTPEDFDDEIRGWLTEAYLYGAPDGDEGASATGSARRRRAAR